jgi:hypothetical protein
LVNLAGCNPQISLGLLCWQYNSEPHRIAKQ